jgi:pyruvate,water dikinase
MRKETILHSTSHHDAELRLKELSLGKYLFIKALLSYAVKYINFRENERFILDLQISRIRPLYLAMGQMLVDRKLLKNKEDVFYLKMSTVRGLLTGDNQDVFSQVTQAKQEFEKNLQTIPPKFLRGDSALEDVQPELVGTPASSGIRKGKARVIATFDEFPTLQVNEILITRIIDPGMSPYFSTIAGVVTEIGGILSHGAILAREYHIPAVTGVNGALDKISTGDDVTIDGDTGRIYLKKNNKVS